MIVKILTLFFIQNSLTAMLVCMLTLSQIIQKLFRDVTNYFLSLRIWLTKSIKYASFIAFDSPLISYIPLSEKAATKNILKTIIMSENISLLGNLWPNYRVYYASSLRKFDNKYNLNILFFKFYLKDCQFKEIT